MSISPEVTDQDQEQGKLVLVSQAGISYDMSEIVVPPTGGLAGSFSLGVLLQILGCVLWHNWWPMLTAFSKHHRHPSPQLPSEFNG